MKSKVGKLAALYSLALLACAFSFGGTEAADAGAVTLALKFVEFKDPAGHVPLTEAQASGVVRDINREYSQCGLAVKLEKYQQVDPAGLGLPYALSAMDQLDEIRAPFEDAKYLVVINTGAWNHLSMGPANAWTAMPGESMSGAVIEGPVAQNAPVVAHELGHYLSLDHVVDSSDMMNPVIYPRSTQITPLQCHEMLSSVRVARADALR